MNNIILIGYMGCGKTTIGKHLARIGRYSFVDTDEEIEVQQGRSISDIFSTDGEEAFRGMETTYLEQLLAKKREGMVLSTGGGMPLREQNRMLLQQLGTVVYLKTRPETVYNRIKGDTKRPLLQCENPIARIEEMLEKRVPIYSEVACYTIETDNLKQGEIAELICKFVKNE